MEPRAETSSSFVRIPIDAHHLDGELIVPSGALGIVVFAHGSGSSRFSPRNIAVARTLERRQLGTLLFDLLTAEEGHIDRLTTHLRFDIDLLARRLMRVTDWLAARPETGALSLGYFGASTGAAAALVAAAARPGNVRAVVSRGGRPDLAGDALLAVSAPTLLVVGGDDLAVLGLNREALARLPGEKRLEVVPGAGHLFEEPGTMDKVAGLAGDWLVRHLAARPS